MAIASIFSQALRKPNQNDRLVQGAQNGQLNRGEFSALNARRNHIEKLKAQMSKDGIDASEQYQIDSLEKSYQEELEIYTKYDVNVAQKQDPNTGKLYDGLRSGDITHSEAAHYLDKERELAKPGGGLMGRAVAKLQHQQKLDDLANNSQVEPFRPSDGSLHPNWVAPSHNHHHFTPYAPTPNHQGLTPIDGRTVRPQIDKLIKNPGANPPPSSLFNMKG